MHIQQIVSFASLTSCGQPFPAKVAQHDGKSNQPVDILALTREIKAKYKLSAVETFAVLDQHQQQ